MLAAFLTVLLIIAGVIRLVVPELVSCVQLLLSEVPGAVDTVVAKLDKTARIPEEIIRSLSSIDWESALSKVLHFLSNGIGSTFSFAASAVSSVAGFTINLLIGVIFSIYLLMGKHRLRAQCGRLLDRYLRPSWNEKLRYALSVLNDSFHKYIVGQCTEAVILGGLCAVGMFIFRFPYAIMTGTVIGVTALIPIAGAYIGGAVGFLLILSRSPIQAVLFIVYLLILQQLEGNLIYPKVVGSSIGLPGIWVLAAVTIGGGISGIGGMLLGVPLAASLYQFLRADLNKVTEYISSPSPVDITQ